MQTSQAHTNEHHCTDIILMFYVRNKMWDGTCNFEEIIHDGVMRYSKHKAEYLLQSPLKLLNSKAN